MSTGYILQISGMSRYDVPAIKVIGGKNVNAWDGTKAKLKLTDSETNAFFAKLKSVTGATVTEKKGLAFSKQVDETQFNKMLSEFCDNYKICKECGIPELCDGKCDACGAQATGRIITNKKEAIIEAQSRADAKRKAKRAAQREAQLKKNEELKVAVVEDEEKVIN